jgi:transposase InsO family protein
MRLSLKCQLSDGFQTIVLNEVMHVPRLHMNLVSLGVLELEGAKGDFGGGGIRVRIGADELLRATLRDDQLYHVDRVVMGQDGSVAYNATSSGSLRLWHRRMGHLHLDAIHSLVSKNLVDGLSISSPKSFDHVCEGCALGKMHRSPFPKLSTTPREKMELIVVDLTVSTWTGMYYALIVVEASCRYGVGDLLKSKDEVADALKRIIAILERQSGKLLKILRCDNGTDFVNDITQDFCRRNGVIHQTAVPYGREQNGLAERTIAVYFEMVRCMLHSSGMDLRYWGEAFMYAVHIQNLSPTRRLPDKVPIHAWTGQKPDVSHLCIFGSIAYANIPKKVRGGKLEATLRKCRLLGWWANETKGYRLEDAETGKLITSRDVQFLEEERPNDLAVIEGDVREAPVLDMAEILPINEKDQLISRLADESRTSNPVGLDNGREVPPEPPKTPPREAPVPIPEAPRAPQTSKCADWPRRELPARNCQPPARYVGGSADDEIDAAIHAKNQHQAFIAYYREPHTYAEAMALRDEKQWERALEEEVKQLEETGTFEWVPKSKVPPGRTIIGSNIVWRAKRDGEGNINKYKA